MQITQGRIAAIKKYHGPTVTTVLGVQGSHYPDSANGNLTCTEHEVALYVLCTQMAISDLNVDVCYTIKNERV